MSQSASLIHRTVARLKQGYALLLGPTRHLLGVTTWSLGLGMVLLLASQLPVHSIDGVNLGPEKKLAALETQLLGATYPNQSLEDRLTRLEDMVFGQAHQGTVVERLKALSTMLEVAPTGSTLDDPYGLKQEPIISDRSQNQG
ncbi:MAG: hypothetical protein KC462_00830, partial [Cyanobacteria bacterium HKST-UBA05]|nr:hypothetical protein [Cyanobacteria bacterium HKST-UBA05]